jgi:hypothetical protein
MTKFKFSWRREIQGLGRAATLASSRPTRFLPRRAGLVFEGRRSIKRRQATPIGSLRASSANERAAGGLSRLRHGGGLARSLAPNVCREAGAGGGP